MIFLRLSDHFIIVIAIIKIDLLLYRWRWLLMAYQQRREILSQLDEGDLIDGIIRQSFFELFIKIADIIQIPLRVVSISRQLLKINILTFVSEHMYLVQLIYQ